MEKIKEIRLLDRKDETKDGTNWTTDTVRITDDNSLHFDSFDFGPLTEQQWGHDYEYSIFVGAEWKDSILLLLLKERFKNSSDFKEWADAKTLPYTRSLW